VKWWAAAAEAARLGRTKTVGFVQSTCGRGCGSSRKEEIMLKSSSRAIGTTALILPVVLFAFPPQARPSATQSAPAAVQNVCQVTVPNGLTPPGEKPSRTHHGNKGLWTALWPEGTVVFRPGGSGFVLRDGSLQMKFPWWRGVEGPLIIEGRRLDEAAPPLRTHIPAGYSPSAPGFQATSLIFPTPGCWEVTGHAGEATLSFVVNVVKIGEGPVQNGSPNTPPNKPLQPTSGGEF
jgi:hypothetical protein